MEQDGGKKVGLLTIYTIETVHIHKSLSTGCENHAQCLIVGYVRKLCTAGTATTNRKDNFEFRIELLELDDSIDAALRAIYLYLFVCKLVTKLYHYKLAPAQLLPDFQSVQIWYHPRLACR